MPESLEQHKSLTVEALEAEQARLSELIDQMRQKEERAVGLSDEEIKPDSSESLEANQDSETSQEGDFQVLEAVASRVITPEYLKNSNFISESKVDELNEIISHIPDQGLPQIVKKLVNNKDSFLLDAFHDVLTATELYDELIASGYIASPKKQNKGGLWWTAAGFLVVLIMIFLILVLIY